MIFKKRSQLETNIEKFSNVSSEDIHNKECNQIVKQTYFMLFLFPFIYFGLLFLALYLEKMSYL